MNLLLITGEYPPMPGGIAGYTDLLRQHLDAAGVKTHVLSHRDSSADVQVAGWDWDTIGRVRQIISDQAVDVVHIQYQAGAFNMHPAINLLPRAIHNVPVVTTFHDLRAPYLFPKAGPLRRLAVKRMARWSAAAVVTNPADRRILEAASIHPETIHLGPSLPTPKGCTPHANCVGFFGFPSVQKGFDILLKAISLIPNDQRPTLKIVGSKPPTTGAHGYLSEREVDELAKAHRVMVEWTGYLDPQEASTALAGCRAIAFPFPAGASLRSSALVAALQTQRPVIVTRPAVVSDLDGLESLPHLVLVDRGDVTGISRAIVESHGPGPAGIALPASFQWPEIARQHRTLYRRLTESRAT